MTAAQLLEDMAIKSETAKAPQAAAGAPPGGEEPPPPDEPDEFSFSAERVEGGDVLFTVAVAGTTLAFQAKREVAIEIRDMVSRAIGSAFARNLTR